MALSLHNEEYETALAKALNYLLFGDRLRFFWHYQFRLVFPSSNQPLRSLSSEGMIEIMAWTLLIGWNEAGIYQGYLVHATLNRSYQLQLSYEQQHPRGYAFMARLFAAWRGDVDHAWPPYAYDQPIYEGILERWREPDPALLLPWLIAACDRHTHQAYGRGGEKTFYDFAALPRTPLEILLLFRLRELVGLENPVIDHPLMEAPFDRMPAHQPPLVYDDLMLGTLKRLREDWPIYDEVVSLEAIKASAMPATSTAR
jgi:hypothetical protein